MRVRVHMGRMLEGMAQKFKSSRLTENRPPRASCFESLRAQRGKLLFLFWPAAAQSNSRQIASAIPNHIARDRCNRNNAYAGLNGLGDSFSIASAGCGFL